jgi:hypothetical protein
MVQLKPPHILGFDGGATFSLLRWQISLLQHDCKRGLHVRSYRCPEERYDAISRSFGSSSSSSSSEPRRVQLDGHANSHIQSSKELHRADYGRYHHVKHNCRPTHQISWCAKNHWNSSKHRCSRSPGLEETIQLKDPVEKTDFSKLGDVNCLWGSPNVYIFNQFASKVVVQYLQVGRSMTGLEANLASANLRSKKITIRGAGPESWTFPQLYGEYGIC